MGREYRRRHKKGVDEYLETILIIITLLFIGFIIMPISVRVCKQQIWEFVKENIEKDAKYKKMVRDMLKGK